MATVFENVHLSSFTEKGEVVNEYETPVRLQVVEDDNGIVRLKIWNDTKELGQGISIDGKIEVASIGKQALLLTTTDRSFFLKFPSHKEMRGFHHKIQEDSSKEKSVFNERTDPSSAEQYFQFYGYLSQQQNMMQDYVRTSTYQRAMLDNTIDFQDKVVLDVGAGSGILSFFAIQAGARKVYAIEASSMAQHCKLLVQNNKLQGKINVIAGKVEELELPEQVDIIISEPMGYMLFNERMLETYLHAKKWLKPGGKMFPTQGDLHVSPFTDEALYMEQFSKANFWYQPSFHGVDLCSLRDAAVQEYFRQPIVDTFDIRICMARSIKYTVDFQTAQETDLHDIEFPLSFLALSSGHVHGLAFWFDVAFIGSQRTVWLSTSPAQPLTHWYQVRCLLQTPLYVKQGQTMAGKVRLQSNVRQSYDVDIELYIPGTNTKSCNTLDLKNPFFRYSGQQPQPPPGTGETSPSDNYWNQQDSTVHVANMAPVNPGSIPAAAIISANDAATQALQTRTSVGGGLAPTVFGQITSSNTVYPISNQFMIGDYVIPGSGTFKLGGV